MCEVIKQNYGRGFIYHAVMCNGTELKRFKGAGAKKKATELCSHLNKTYAV